MYNNFSESISSAALIDKGLLKENYYVLHWIKLKGKLMTLNDH